MYNRQLRNHAKGGFYPFPESDLPYVANLFRKGQGRLLDPCAGQGDALGFLAEAWGLEPYAIELEGNNAQVCINKFSPMNAISGDMYSTAITKGSMQVMFINPPFSQDSDSEDKRREADMLYRAWDWVQIGGWIVFISLSSHITKSLAQYVCKRSIRTELFRTPDPYMDNFTLTILVCQVGKPHDDYRERAKLLHELAQSDSIPSIHDVKPTRSITKTDTKDFHFYSHSNFVDEQAQHLIKREGVDLDADFLLAVTPPPEIRPVNPVTKPKLGHMVTLIAAGLFNSLVLDTDRGKAVLRSVVYRTEETVKEGEDIDGNVIETARVSPRVMIAITYENGDIEFINNDDSLIEFIRTYKDTLLAHVDKWFTPLYIIGERGIWGEDLDRQRVKGKHPLFQAQQEVAAATLTSLQKSKRAILVGDMSTGKAQPLDAKILTPSGWKRMGDVQIGDSIINSKGLTSTVIGVFPQGEKEVYRVTFNDGSSTECCEDHLWKINSFLRDSRGNEPMVKPLKEFMHKLRDGAGNKTWRIPMISPVEFDSKDLPIDPYLLGVLLGDGHLGDHGISISTSDPQILSEISPLIPLPLSIKHVSRYDYRITGSRSNLRANPLLDAIRSLKLDGKKSHEKFIPEVYKMASKEQRLALLQGLMDTDGYGNRSPHFSSSSEKLANDVRQLVWSLGGYASISEKMPTYSYKCEKKAGRKAYLVNIQLNMPIFRLTRKLEAYSKRTATKIKPVRSIDKVEFTGKKQTQCIMVDSEDSLYVTDDYVLTHNTSMSIAMISAWINVVKVWQKKPGQVYWVNCPTHLVKKWRRELNAQMPGCEVTMLLSGEDMLDAVAKAFRSAKENPSVTHVVIASQDSIKLGEGWKSAYNIQTYRRPYPFMSDRRVICPTTGEQLMIYDKKEKKDRPLEPDEIDAKQMMHGTHALWSQIRLFRLPKRHNGVVRKLWWNDPEVLAGGVYKGGREHRGEFKRIRFRYRAFNRKAYIPDMWLASKGIRAGNPRGPVWQWLKKHGKGRIAIVFCDEIHESSGMDTDRFRSMSVIVKCADAKVGLTGTVFNGYARSLRALEMLFNASIFERYPYGSTGDAQWVRDMGVLEKVYKHTDETSENGRYTGVKRKLVSTKELPGASPLLIREIIDHTVFFSLSDIGSALVPLREEPVMFDMSDEQQTAYDELDRIITSYQKQRIMLHDNTFMGTWFNALLHHPDTAFRAMQVIHKIRERDPYSRRITKEELKVVATTAAIDGLLPKEEWLIDLVQRQAGRGIAIFVQQTDTRDYQERLFNLLKPYRNPVILSAKKVKPIDREEWIEKKVKQGHDLLICNPQLVQTGLDLIDFPTLVFHEPPPTLSTLVQTSRRHWRIPQTQDCETYHLGYNGTMQERMIRLNARKRAAASIVSGDTATLNPNIEDSVGLAALLDDMIQYIDLKQEFAQINKRVVTNNWGEEKQPVQESVVIEQLAAAFERFIQLPLF